MENEEESSETETVALVEAAFSQMSVAVDPFSTLPEHVLHRIFSFLPSPKEVARTTALSKQWFRAWRSFPVSNFDIADFMAGSVPEVDDQMEAQCSEFIKFVDDTLLRIGRHNTGSESFNLTTVDWMAPHLSRWIHRALDNRVQKVTLRFLLKASSTDWVPCLLPIRVFSADSITCLVLNGPMIVLPLDEISSVNLPSLKTLSFMNCAISDEQLQKILRGCPMLEDIALSYCESLSEIVISGFPNLKGVLVCVDTPDAKLTLIRIKAPNLEGFCYKSGCYSAGNVTVKVNHSPNLKCLEFDDRHRTDKWFHEFLAKFPLLEFLKIVNCKSLKRIRISNPLLRDMTIQNCNFLKDVLIESNKMRSFGLFGFHESLPELTVRIDSPSVDCVAQVVAFFVCWDQMLKSKLFFKLQEFLMRSIKFRIFSYCLTAGPAQNDSVRISNAHKQFPTSAYKMECLDIGVSAPEASYSFIMNGLLSACHPAMVNLVIYPEVIKLDFVKFFCEELGKKPPQNRKSCCKLDVKCWKHQLKGVKVERVTIGDEHVEDLDLPGLINLVPTLQDHDVIHLRLEW